MAILIPMIRCILTFALAAVLVQVQQAGVLSPRMRLKPPTTTTWKPSRPQATILAAASSGPLALLGLVVAMAILIIVSVLMLHMLLQEITKLIQIELEKIIYILVDVNQVAIFLFLM